MKITNIFLDGVNDLVNEVTVGVITMRRGQALMKFPKEHRADILQKIRNDVPFKYAVLTQLKVRPRGGQLANRCTNEHWATII